MYVHFNPNPAGHSVGDCVIRALCKATGESWDKTFVELAVTGFELSDMPSANAVWGAYLHRKGYTRTALLSLRRMTSLRRSSRPMFP